MERLFSILAGVAWLIALGGCAQRTDLEPAPGANTVAGMDEAARSSVEGVRVIAQATGWPGAAPIREEVTPLRVVIRNESGQPVRLRYSEFALVSADGKRYAALPPFRIGGNVSEPVLIDRYDPIGDPAFVHDEFFEVAPVYDPVYDMAVFGDPFFYDFGYYDTYGTYWAEIALPTREMLRRALPEGVLKSGGRVEGFLYFEKVGDVDRVTFRADLVNAESGRAFGEVRIPMTVE